MAGFVLSEDQIGRLCVDAWGVSQEMLDNAGPFDCAYMYLGSRINLNSPDVIDFWYKDPKTKLPKEAWMLLCRLAFVQPGVTVPNLSFDAEAEAYIDHWFPPHIRASAAFENIKYAQVEYKGSCDCASTCLRSRQRIFRCSSALHHQTHILSRDKLLHILRRVALRFRTSRSSGWQYRSPKDKSIL